MQVLFQSSAESSKFAGLGIVPAPIQRFEDVDKSVPHIGWNTADQVQQLGEKHSSSTEDSPRHYYFVHSYCAKYRPDLEPQMKEWIYSTTQYGGELFISAIQRKNVFCTQYHPEKSGEAGLQLIDSWLSSLPSSEDRAITYLTPTLKAKDSLTRRVIACMDVRANDEGDLVVTKGDQYDVREKAAPSASLTESPTTIKAQTAGAVRNLGKPVSLAAKYYAAGADELCLLNITSFRHSPLQDQPMLAVVRAAAEHVFVPLTIGGGIKDSVDPDGTKRSAVDVAGAYFRAGADKVSIGSEAVYAVEKLRNELNGKGDGTSAIETIAHAYGRQAVVVSIDPRRQYVDAATYDGEHSEELVRGLPDGPEAERGKAWWYQATVSGGRENRPLSAVQLAQGAESLGAGEILLNSIDRDGTGLGFDLNLIKLVKRNVKIPVVASSGAGRTEHFTQVFQQADADAALAAGIFHREEVKIVDVKQALVAAGVNTRTYNR
jgi:glutamine amidotransferase/cyclase